MGRGWTPSTAAASASFNGRETAALDQSRFVGVKGKSDVRQAVRQCLQKLRGVLVILEPKNEIVRIPHDNYVAGGVLLSPQVRPQVENIVEIHVRKERRNDRSLWRAHGCCRPLTILRYPRLQPFTDQTEY